MVRSSRLVFVTMFVGLATGGVLAVVHRPDDPAWLSILMRVSLGWGLLNLLPIFPFAGGRALAQWLGPRRGTTLMLVSIFAAEAAAAIGVTLFKSPLLGMVLVGGGVGAVLNWTKARRAEGETASVEKLDAARSLLTQGKHRQARQWAIESAKLTKSVQIRNGALTTLAWVALHEGAPAKARELLGRVRPRRAVDAHCLAAVEHADGHPESAIEALEHARRERALNRAAARFLVDLYAAAGDFRLVVRAAIDLSWVLGVEDVQLIGSALEKAGEFQGAAEVAAALSKLPADRLPKLGAKDV